MSRWLIHRNSLDGAQLAHRDFGGIAFIIDLSRAAAAHFEFATEHVAADASRANDAALDVGCIHLIGLYFSRTHQFDVQVIARAVGNEFALTAKDLQLQF